MAPSDLKYMTSHEWIRLGGSRGRVGITDFAVAEVKDIVYVDLPAVGTPAKAGEAFGAIETVKAAFDLYAPLSGTVVAVNPALAGHPETVSADPFGQGWMLEIEPADPAKAAGELAALLDAAAYDSHCRAQPKH